MITNNNPNSKKRSEQIQRYKNFNTPNEILSSHREIIKNVKHRKAAGIDQISNKQIKNHPKKYDKYNFNMFALNINVF